MFRYLQPILVPSEDIWVQWGDVMVPGLVLWRDVLLLEKCCKEQGHSREFLCRGIQDILLSFSSLLKHKTTAVGERYPLP